MPRRLKDIIAHIRAVVANPNVSATLIQTEDLAVLCDVAEAAESIHEQTARPTYTAANNEELPEGAPGTTIVNDGRPT